MPASWLTLDDLRMALRLWRDVPPFLRAPVTAEEARATVRRRLERREEDFLALVRPAVYEHPSSPYRELLRLAGCEYGDLERLVRQDGLEGTLRALLRQGVYLTVDEFKGRRPARRGSAAVEVTRRGLRNPAATAHIAGQTGGSRGARTPLPIDLRFLRDQAVNLRLVLELRGGRDWRRAYWAEPGGTVLAWLLIYAGAGTPLARWFSPLDPAAGTLPARFRWAHRWLHWDARRAGVHLPRPEHAPPEDPRALLHWFREVRGSGATPYVVGYVSSLVRLCQAAADAGIEVAGTPALAVGEPLTERRLAVLRGAGLDVRGNYSSTEAGNIGYGCEAAQAPDEVHVLADLLAVVQAPGGADLPGLPPSALFLSSLRSTTPLILLNLSPGDQGVLEERGCGCAFEAVGWSPRLHTIRSFEKLTAGGMSFLDSDLVGAIDEVLPRRFGGAPIDYQLVEEEGEDGSPVLRLLVHPDVGPLDAGALLEAFLSAIGRGSATEQVMAALWRDGRLLRVERRPPIATPAGKILHLHTDRKASRGGSPRP